MKIIIIPLFITGFLLLNGCSENSSNTGKPVTVTDRTTDSLKLFINSYYQTMSSRNWQQYKTYFWNNATLTTIWQKPGDSLPAVHITTIEDFIKQTHLGPDSKPIFEEYMTGEPTISIEKNVAVVKAMYYARFGTKDSLSEWNGTDVFTLMRHKNDWKIVSLVYE